MSSAYVPCVLISLEQFYCVNNTLNVKPSGKWTGRRSVSSFVVVLKFLKFRNFLNLSVSCKQFGKIEKDRGQKHPTT